MITSMTENRRDFLPRGAAYGVDGARAARRARHIRGCRAAGDLA